MKDYVYYEDDWFSGIKYNNDNLMWRYWAAEEIAYTILDNDSDCYMDDFRKPYGKIYFDEYRNFVAQLLKKEWFR